MNYGVATDVRRFRYTDGEFATPEAEHWLIEYEHEFDHHQRVKNCHIHVGLRDDLTGTVYSTPERYHKVAKDMADYDLITTLETGVVKGRRALLGGSNTTCVRKEVSPGKPIEIPFPSLAQQRHREGGIGMVLPESGVRVTFTPPKPLTPTVPNFVLDEPHSDGLVSLQRMGLAGKSFGRSVPTEEGGYMLPPGSQLRVAGRMPGRITAGLNALLDRQEEAMIESFNRVRVQIPDHIVARHHDFILQHPDVDIGVALVCVTETRMLAGVHRFKEAAGKIKKLKAKRKEKSNGHKVRGRSRSRDRS